MPHLREIMNKINRPKAGKAYDYWRPLLKSWGVNLSDQEFMDYWFRVELVSDRMIKFCEYVKSKGIKIIILTNVMDAITAVVFFLLNKMFSIV